MAKSVITIHVNYHPATKAMERIKTLLDFCADSYGVSSLTYEIEDEE